MDTTKKVILSYIGYFIVLGILSTIVQRMYNIDIRMGYLFVAPMLIHLMIYLYKTNTTNEPIELTFKYWMYFVSITILCFGLIINYSNVSLNTYNLVNSLFTWMLLLTLIFYTSKQIYLRHQEKKETEKKIQEVVSQEQEQNESLKEDPTLEGEPEQLEVKKEEELK